MSQQVKAYLTPEQHDRWKQEAEERDMSLSEFIQSMTEAGLKKFEVRAKPDDTNRELREQNRRLAEDLADAQDRIDTLESRLMNTETQAIIKHISENPGTSYTDVLQHVKNSAEKGRTQDAVQSLLGEEIVRKDGGYYLAGEQP